MQSIKIWDPKSSADDPRPGSEQARHEQISKIVKSAAFRNASLLQRTLEFIVEKSEDGHLSELDEYSIAVRVLGRKPDFDPLADTSVRTHMYRLRTKLKEYYANEGAADNLILEIPKGHYLPSFTARRQADNSPGAAGENRPISSGSLAFPASGSQIRKHSWLLIASFCIVSIFSVLFGLAIGRFLTRTYRSPTPAAGVDAELLSFWGKRSSENGVVVAFTNPEFLESGSGELSPYSGPTGADRGALAGQFRNSAESGNIRLGNRMEPRYFEDGFTGTGEVFAVHNLTEILNAMNLQMTLLRSRSLSAAEFKDHDIIFLGSPGWNTLLEQIELPKRFIFLSSSSTLWQGEIEDTAAKSPAARIFKVERNPTTHVIQADYGLFQVFPGPSPKHRIVLLAGLTTTGTQGAAAFATSPEGLSQVRKSLNLNSGANDPLPDSFECLLRVEAARGLDALQVNPVACSKIP